MQKVNECAFKQIPLYNLFHYQGMFWYKRSKTTAHPWGFSSQWKYFKQNTQVQ
jgi:hypothetical protein